MANTYPGGHNTYIPGTGEAQAAIVVDFSRNVESFAINRYAQIVPVTKQEGRYVEMTVEQAGRIGGDLVRHWADGVPRPSGIGNAEAFEFKAYLTERKESGFLLGNLAVDQAAWDVIASNARSTAQRMMTYRTQQVVTLATTSGNYAVSNTSAVASITGNAGKWDVSTTARNDIKRSFDHAADIIRRSTLGAVSPADLIVVMSPGCARKMAVSQEITDYLKGSADARTYIEGKLGPNAQYGLPPTLFGYPIVVEDAVKTTNRKGVAKVTAYVLGDDTPFMCSRVGGLVGVEGAPSFSSLSLFMKEEMTVETRVEDWDRLTAGSLVEDFAAVFTAPASAFLFTAAVAA